MKVQDFELYDRAIFYATELIVKPNTEFGFDEYDKKQFAEIIIDVLNNPNKFVQQLTSELGNYAKNWNIDWYWISHHILWDNYNLRESKRILKMNGPDTLVYKELTEKQGFESRKLYLTDPNDLNSAPKIFKIQEIINNGTNIGKLKTEWKPVVGITDFGFYEFHPYDDKTNSKEIGHHIDNSSLIALPFGYIWDKTEQNFKLEIKPLTERQKKIRSLIKIRIIKDK